MRALLMFESLRRVISAAMCGKKIPEIYSILPEWSVPVCGQSLDKILGKRLLYHYCMDFVDVRFGVLVPDPNRSDPYHRAACEWLARQVGFWPLFTAVGHSLDTYWITGYDHNWTRIMVRSRTGTVLRKAGESPNFVLFSFEELDGIFMDYNYWNLVVIADNIKKEIGLVQKRWIFKPAWSRRKWLQYTLKVYPGNVQMVCKELDVRRAKRIWVRNKKTKHALERLGFSGVEVHRIPIFGG